MPKPITEILCCACGKSMGADYPGKIIVHGAECDATGKPQFGAAMFCSRECASTYVPSSDVLTLAKLSAIKQWMGEPTEEEKERFCRYWNPRAHAESIRHPQGNM